MREKVIEQKLVEVVKKSDGLCLKLIGFIGLPDRLVLLPNGKLGFVEVKAPNKKPRAVQIKRMNQLKQLGFQCLVLDDELKIREVIDAIQTT